MAIEQITMRLNRIFENVLGCRLEYQRTEDLSLVDWDFKDLTEMKGDAAIAPKYIVSKSTDSFGFPVRRENELMGLAVVHGFKDARPKRLLILAELMTMVLDYGVRAGDRADKLRIIEERMTEFADESSNVIPLRPARFERVLQVTETEYEEHDSLTSPLLNSPLLLVSTAQFPVNRVAIEIHELSGRWAFVSVEDLPADVFNSRESIEELGGLTLFIRDIAALNTNQQLKLAEYLARAASEDTPHVIAATSASIDDLIHQGRILPYLSRLFTVSTLNTDTSKSASQITKELVEASLQQLVANARSTAAEEHKSAITSFRSTPSTFIQTINRPCTK
jgi:hypothetical protein